MESKFKITLAPEGYEIFSWTSIFGDFQVFFQENKFQSFFKKGIFDIQHGLYSSTVEQTIKKYWSWTQEPEYIVDGVDFFPHFFSLLPTSKMSYLRHDGVETFCPDLNLGFRFYYAYSPRLIYFLIPNEYQEGFGLNFVTQNEGIENHRIFLQRVSIIIAKAKLKQNNPDFDQFQFFE